MQGIQFGGGRHVDALLTELKQALDLMPVKHMPDRLSQHERLEALIWVSLMTDPASGIREPSPPTGSWRSARLPSLWASA
jgi:hypothetical protein